MGRNLLRVPFCIYGHAFVHHHIGVNLKGMPHNLSAIVNPLPKWYKPAQSLAKIASALLTETSRPGSFSAYVILPLSMIRAYLAVRSPIVQPSFVENEVPGSERKSWVAKVSFRFNFPTVGPGRRGLTISSLIPLALPQACSWQSRS